ncbi:LOW QUALITY PROTEIN: uncharacterized protein LOC115337561, partial [Aquila chrysaetos chrysaetos]|uniref:LOW QUALITY PROTEIN: uncharacterized protein LOC115337561 n=1 Tax=Aquila chrysaetos chrysaetos TaxID=223781 RepID=UPI001B7D4272
MGFVSIKLLTSLKKGAAEPPRSSTLCHLHRCGWDRAVLHIPKATKSHPCPCCFGGSFCDASDVLGADLLDCSYSMPDLQLVRRVVSQVEFYLSDENLAKDAFLLKHVQENKMGFVSIKLLTSLKKVKYLTHDWGLMLYTLQFSELLEVNEEGTTVRRVSSTGFSVSWVPIPESQLSIPPSKLLLAWELLPLEQDMLHKDPSAPSWPGSNFKPSGFGNAFAGLLLASKVLPPLGTGSFYGLCSSPESTRGCGWGSGHIAAAISEELYCRIRQGFILE